MTKYNIDDIKTVMENNCILLSETGVYCIPLYIKNETKIYGRWYDDIKYVYTIENDIGWNDLKNVKKIIYTNKEQKIDGILIKMGYSI